MPRFTVAVRGRGRASVAAFGIADAEHLVQKEIGRAWPDARVEVLGVSRTAEPRIVEELTVDYRVSGTIEVEAESDEKAAGPAFRQARRLLTDTRYRQTEWSRVTPPSS